MQLLISFSFVILVLADEILRLVEVRSYFDKPGWLDLYHIPHVLLSCQDKFMINYALRLIFVEHRAWMYPHIHVVLGCLIDLLSMVLGTVHKESTDNAFTDVSILVVLVDTQLLIIDVHLYPLKQAG